MHAQVFLLRKLSTNSATNTGWQYRYRKICKMVLIIFERINYTVLNEYQFIKKLFLLTYIQVFQTAFIQLLTFVNPTHSISFKLNFCLFTCVQSNLTNCVTQCCPGQRSALFLVFTDSAVLEITCYSFLLNTVNKVTFSGCVLDP